jgi:hypothetical protein
MALVCCILGKSLGVVCHCFPLHLDVTTFATRCPHVRHNARDPSSGRWNCGREYFRVSLPTWQLCHLGIFYTPQIYTWDWRLYFPSEGRCAEEFFTLKNLMALAGFEPANLGTKGRHATPRKDVPMIYVHLVVTVIIDSGGEQRH